MILAIAYILKTYTENIRASDCDFTKPVEFIISQKYHNLNKLPVVNYNKIHFKKYFPQQQNPIR